MARAIFPFIADAGTRNYLNLDFEKPTYNTSLRPEPKCISDLKVKINRSKLDDTDQEFEPRRVSRSPCTTNQRRAVAEQHLFRLA